ncbi:helix-turn-helix transcriptional regulator [Leptolyngbya sp. FACHB-261]|uniref:helix-turn-helix transcriptional regulator n=1 Tax=Leptolyngbya sp. FACHB-261 TaxID=2692806 RepID=UPI0016888DFF|nr:helix-turn-helix transcriptional regulator [Leptolyngbya sp. FACHB-261]MBD2101406.1 helix-turn-helix transcriptional regulator [Leptolyngbya sp. FACHB-261]
MTIATTNQLERLDDHFFHDFEQHLLFQGVIESFIDGILILTEQGRLIHTNEPGRRICCQLAQSLAQPIPIPPVIWQVCQSLIESSSTNSQAVLETEILNGRSTAFRLRVQWLQLDQAKQRLILVTLEDCYGSAQNRLLADAHKYGLTPRETEIWLLYRANHTYKEIAASLFITINTVRKHMKNIHLKRKTDCPLAV